MTICPAGVDLAGRRISGEVAVDGGDPAAGDPDVEPALVPAAGIDDLAAADQQVEAHIPAHSSRAARIESSASSRRKP